MSDSQSGSSHAGFPSLAPTLLDDENAMIIKQKHVDDLGSTRFVDDVQHAFDRLGQDLFNYIESKEELSLSLTGEDSTFIRFSQGKIRQSTDVRQAEVALLYRYSGAEVRLQMPLLLDDTENKERALRLLGDAQKMREGLPADPYLVPLQRHETSNNSFCRNTQYNIDSVFEKLSPFDAAGLWCSGPILRGYMSHMGTKHLFATDQFFLDYSLYTPDQKAVKKLLAGSSLDLDTLDAQLDEAKEALHLFKTPSKTLEPGAYRVYFSPAAVEALMGMASWGGLGYGSYKKGGSAFKDLADGKKTLSPKVTLSQDFSHDLMPRFNAQGATAPEHLTLIEKGELKNWLVSDRTAKEYGVLSNAAAEGDGLVTATLKTGTLSQGAILNTLGTGLYVDNLHYLNWSDVQSGRITGMTRYACFWVENGQKIAPIKDMRFDETLYHFLGEGLVDLTSHSQLITDTGTYYNRSLEVNRMPGMLVEGFHFTL